MEKSAYQKWKEGLGETRPWDFVNPNTNFVVEEKQTARFNICKVCPELVKLTSQCKKCGCFMSAKTKLEKATCPLQKW